MPSKWSSTAHENSSIGQTLYLLPTRGCFLSETLNKTLSLNAGFGCCIEVFRRRIAEPSLNFPLSIACHFSRVSFVDCLRCAQSTPFALQSRSFSAAHSQT